MSDFKAKMHTKSISTAALPQTQLGELTSNPDPLAVFKGPTSKGRAEEKGGEGKGR